MKNFAFAALALAIGQMAMAESIFIRGLKINSSGQVVLTVNSDINLKVADLDVKVYYRDTTPETVSGSWTQAHAVTVDGSGSQFTLNVTPSSTENLPNLFVHSNALYWKVVTEIEGVQLWANGPYWASCNVGATKPEEFGYLFWWGDTVGYTSSSWTGTSSQKYTGVTWVSSEGESMSSSPFTTSCPTYNKSKQSLLDDGYIDSTGNLAAEHDAATVHLGSPWRMPTDAELQKLVSSTYCTVSWTDRNGVYGRLVTGKGDYSSKSIFLPAAGRGEGTDFWYSGERGHYWTSTPYSDGNTHARYLYLHSGGFARGYNLRYYGQSVRPVRD